MPILKRILNSFIFWGAWIIVSVIMEIIPALGSIGLLIKRRFQNRKPYERPVIDPEISVIIPVYNSAETLFSCIRSIAESTYSTESIRVFLVNNGGSDNSFSVFADCQKAFPDLRMQWLNAEQGKSRAMNLALYNSSGKYIINLDSDGRLEKNALANLVAKFEANPDLNCMTGAILTEPEKIRAGKLGFLRLTRNLEFMEYAQAFLAGRSYASETDSVYTLSGAFSAFRKSAVLNSWLYNTDTICEDTHITFQMRYRQGERVEICENAIYFTDPIESMDKLYTQRQRWQRGSLEVAQMFLNKNFRVSRLGKDVNVRTLLFDHTFALPRMIWYLAMICLVFMNYSGQTILYAMGVIFLLYILIGFFYFFSVLAFLKLGAPERKYYAKHWWCIFLLPFFNILVFFIRMAGIINSISTDSSWRTRTFSEEWEAFCATAKKLCRKPLEVLEKFRGLVNRKLPEKYDEPEQPAKEEPGKRECAPCSVGWYIGTGVLWTLSALLCVAVYWSRKTFGVEINEIWNTLKGGTEGTGAGMVTEILTGLMLPVAVALGCWVAFCIADRFFARKFRRCQGYRSFYTVILYSAAALLFLSVVYANASYGLLDYFELQGSRTTLYEEQYVSPGNVAITSSGKTKNLIAIYVESLETTYASVEAGGRQQENFIPRLTALAQENLSFGDTPGLGGFHCTQGTNWTMAALFASTSGVPYAQPASVQMFDEDEKLFPGIVTLGDVLEEKGYRQMFFCGSEGSFAGRSNYFRQHGGYEIFDLFSAREKGYVPENYYHSWGIEDKVLFDIAREELTDLASGGEPFNFTLLTVDLHAPDGYLCDWCEDKYSNVTANVAGCTDRLVADFVDWCRTQSFYRDSVIVIVGDHPRMDGNLVDGAEYYDRTVYDCILNSDTACEADVKDRTFTTMDLFPTTLAAMGFEIEGNRLGLGANLFSTEKTLAEKKGFDWLNSEVLKTSEYYTNVFVQQPVQGGTGKEAAK